MYDLYKRELRRPSKPNFTEKQLPGLDALLAHLDIQCNAVFHGIAETQTRNVRFGSNVYLGEGNPECIDMRMVLEVCAPILSCIPDDLRKFSEGCE